MKNLTKLLLALVACLSMVGFAACGGDDDNGGGGQNLSGNIRIDGSSTVAPLSEAAAELFNEENPDVRVSVGTSGTGGGFEKFCAGETDISDASRPIDEQEVQLCEENGIRYQELAVANDALAVVINPENDWAECLTVDQLNTMWDRGSDVDNWQDVDPEFPDEELTLYGPGTDSGTFDYFTEAINGEEGVQRTEYNNIGEDDNATVTGVSGERGALGYLGYSFVQNNQGRIKAAAIDDGQGGEGCVEPSVETAQNGTYLPLSRELFVYPSDKALQKPEVRAFLEFYIQNSQQIAEQAQYIPLTEEQMADAQAKLEQLAGGGGGGGGTTAPE